MWCVWQRDRDREKQRHREMHPQRETETEKWTHRDTDRQIDRICYVLMRICVETRGEMIIFWLVFKTGSLSGTWSAQIRLFWLSHLPVSQESYLLSTFVTCPAFMWVLQLSLRSPGLPGKQFTDWATSQAPPRNFKHVYLEEEEKFLKELCACPCVWILVFVQ